MKKFLFIIFVLLLIPFTVYADFTDSNEPVINLSIDDAISRLEQGNPELELIKKKIDIYEKKYKTALEQAERAKSMQGYSEQLNIKYREEERLNWQLRALELDDIRNQYHTTLLNKKYYLKQLYFNILISQNELDLINTEITNIDKKVQELSVKIKLGKALENDRKLLNAEKLMLTNQKNEVKKQIDNAMINLKKELGIEISKQISLQNSIQEYKIMDLTNIDERIRDAVKYNFEFLKLDRKYKLKALEKQIIIENTSNRDSLDMTSYDIALFEIEAQIKSKQASITGDLWIEYNTLLMLEDDIKLEELNLELEKLNYDATQAKVKLGIMNIAAEYTSRVAYNRQKNNLQRAKYNYILAAEQLYEKLGI